MLTVSIPDLKPNSQDTSAFYLRNIYQLFGSPNLDPNVSHPLIPPTLATPPAFSPPRYAIWVNSLWFLSLALSLSGATVATLFRNWAVQYISVTRPPCDTPEKQARIRAIFAKGNPGPNAIWGATEGPIFLHLSLFLFIVGGLIYLFNINRAVFYAVVWWVGYMAILYISRTVAPFLEPHSLFHTPLSSFALSVYLGISHAVIRICSCISSFRGLHNNTRRRYRDLSDRYGKGFIIGKRREAREIASKPSSEIDALILERILLTLDEDRAMETFFDAIPGFCTAKLGVLPLSFPVQTKLRQTLDGFLNRTFLSNLISESVRTGRLITCLNAAHVALGPYAVSGVLDNIFNGHWDKALQSVEIGHALRLWGHRRDHDPNIRRIMACIVVRVRERDDRWIMLVKEAFGIPDSVLRECLAHGDSVLLSILIHVARQANRAGFWTSGILLSLSKFDIHNTLPELQHDFCTLWNEIAQEASNQVSFSSPAKILREIRHLYIALHQGTDAIPTAFSASTDSLDFVLDQPLSYSLCDIAAHRPDSTAHLHITDSRAVSISAQPDYPPDASHYPPSHGGNVVPPQAKQANIIVGQPSPSNPTTTCEIGESFLAPTTAEPAVPLPTDAPQPGSAAAALRGIPSTTTVSHPLECNKRQDVVAPCAAPDVSEISSTGPTPAPTSISAPILASTPPTLNKSLVSLDAGLASTSNTLFPAPSIVGISIPGSRPPSRLSPLQITNPITTLPPTIDSDMLPRLRARGLVNSENNCFANAVLQLLVHCPQFWKLFGDLGRLIEWQGLGEGQETRSGATPLVDAMAKFLDEFVYKKLSVVPQLQQSAASGKAREDEEGKKEHDIVNPSYMYDAMKEKGQLKVLLVRSRIQHAPFCYQFALGYCVKDGKHHDAEEFLGLYLDALDEELVELQSYIGTQKSATPGVEELEEEAQSVKGQIAVRKRDFIVHQVFRC